MQTNIRATSQGAPPLLDEKKSMAVGCNSEVFSQEVHRTCARRSANMVKHKCVFMHVTQEDDKVTPLQQQLLASKKSRTGPCTAMMSSGKKSGASMRQRMNRSHLNGRQNNKNWLETMRETKNVSAPLKKMQTKQTGTQAMQLTMSNKQRMPINKDLKQSKEVIDAFVSSAQHI